MLELGELGQVVGLLIIAALVAALFPSRKD